MLSLLGALAFKLRQLLEGSLLVRERASYPAVASQLRIRGDELKAFMATARRSDPRRLARALSALREADNLIKSTSVDGRSLLERSLVVAAS